MYLTLIPYEMSCSDIGTPEDIQTGEKVSFADVTTVLQRGQQM